MFIGNVILICVERDSGEIVASSAKLCVNTPQLNWWFMHNVHDIAGSSFSCNLVFYLEEVSIAHYTDNPVSSSPF